MINLLDLFSGIGGFTLASSWVGGYRTVGFCEIEGFCRDLLKQNFPGIPIFEDVKKLHPEDVIRQREPVHLITAGFPCQDISQAGVGRGIKAERSGLFFEILRLSDEFYAYSGVRPALLLENVANILSGGGGEWARIVHGEVASRGYDCEWKIVSAASVGAPHLRKRWWCIAYKAYSHTDTVRCLYRESEEQSNKTRVNALSQPTEICENVAHSNNDRSKIGHSECSKQDRQGETDNALSCRENVAYSNSNREIGDQSEDRERGRIKQGSQGGGDSQGESESGICGVASRIPNWIHEPDIPRVTTEKKNRVKRLKSLGNSIVPQCAMIPLIRFREIYEEQNKT